MKYQVRNMVGLLLAIGNDKKEVEDVSILLQAKSRQRAVKTAPAAGLYLKKVWY